MNEHALTLKALTDILLNDVAYSWLQRREAAISMAKLFASLNVYNLSEQNDPLKNNEVILGTGYAVSTWSAGMCLLEIARTAVFVKGIVEAVSALKDRTGERPLNILDAGCGPFALLSVLTSLYFKPEEVRFHLIDIIPENMNLSEHLITKLGLSDHFGGMFVTDATKFTWNNGRPLHMVISETMLNALRKEPQAAVTLNLAKQLVPYGIFIPEKISIELMQVEGWKRQEFQMQMEPPADSCRQNFERKVSDIMQLDKFAVATQNNSIELKKITLPDSYDPAVHSLELYTTIHVFNENVLRYGDCSLTLPYAIARPFKAPLPRRAELQFRYDISRTPGINFQIVSL